MSLDSVSAQELSDLIGAIYDCALEPQHWLATCRKIAHLSNSTAGGLCVHDPRQGRSEALFVFGYQPEVLEHLESRYADSPLAMGDSALRPGEVSALSMERFHLADTPFFRDVMQPFGLVDMIWFPALRTGGRIASLHASRSVPAAHYQLDDLRLFELLSPHVCRALAISHVLDIKALKSELLETTLDGLAAGVFLTASDGSVVYMNNAAQRQVKAAGAIRLVNNRLSPVDPAARAALTKAIQDAGSDSPEIDMSEHSVAIPDGSGGGYVASLLPIEGGQRRGIFESFAASVAVFTQDPIQVPLLPGEAFARLHKLTGSELRVLLALSQGLGGMEVAGMLGISEPTIRTHLQHLFTKTGTTRQADLLRLLHNSTPPIRTLRSPAAATRDARP
jgi:DNA-binding CsgD family transcriptional regulator/PAS domain-containing protein